MKTDTPPIPLTSHFGTTLGAERKRLGLTQAEVARLARIGRQKLIQVEQGKPGVAVAAYAAAMDALGLVPELRIGSRQYGGVQTCEPELVIENWLNPPLNG